MKSKTILWLSVVLMLETGLIHLFNAQHEFEEAAILGYLFVFNFLGALVAAYGIYRQRLWGWVLGCAIAVGSLAGYGWSRTSGLPGLEPVEWLNPWGIVSLIVEGSFVLLFFLRPWRRLAAGSMASPLPSRLGGVLVPVGLFLFILFNGLVSQWNIIAGDEHEHLLIAEETINLPLTSMSELEREYGMRVSQVAISALDSIVDVRLQIVDPGKAHDLLESHAALLVDRQNLIFAPHMHSHSKVKPGQIYFMFFPTQNGTVRIGSQVSLVFDGLRVEPVIAR